MSPPQRPRPPRLAWWLLERTTHHDIRWSALGDAEELFTERVQQTNLASARFWFWGQVFASLPAFLLDTFSSSTAMLRNYLIIALRNLWRHKGYTFINVSGLSVGLACCALIVLYVQDEWSYDRYHTQADHIYRMVEIIGTAEEAASVPFPVGPTLVEDYPDVVRQATRFYNMQAPVLSLAYLPETGQPRSFNERRFFFTDPSIFEVFDFVLVQGDPATALAQPHSIVLTETAARKYFGETNPLGKALVFEGEHTLTVRGVLEDVPANSHFHFDMLASFSTLESVYADNPALLEGWAWNPVWTYLLLHEKADPATLEAQFPGFVDQYFHPAIKDMISLYLQPLTDIHLYSQLDFELGPNSDIAYVYIFSAIAVFILLIACINFMNLATARSVKRAQEVGVRKALGAHRLQLMKQFLGESLLTTVLAAAIAIPLLYALLPVLNDIAGKALTLHLSEHAWLFGLLFGVSVLVGLLSGLYPALFLSSFQPTEVLKSQVRLGRASLAVWLRKGLVVTQFAISIALLVCTAIVYQHLSFLRDARLGFDESQVLMVTLPQSGFLDNYATLKNEWTANNQVQEVTITQNILGSNHDSCPLRPEGFDTLQQIKCTRVHDDFVDTFGMHLLAGRDFSVDFPADPGTTLILNESAVNMLDWGDPEDAIGKRFLTQDGNPWGTVVGVTRDYHFASLHHSIDPFIALRLPSNPLPLGLFSRYVAIRISTESVPETIAHLQQAWQTLLPTAPFDFVFLDQDLEQLYRAEETLGQTASAFSILAILIACLGLFGLASFMTEQRTREIGIRKVLGASTSSVVTLLSKEFVQLVLLSMLVGWPLAYIALDWWLQSFAFRPDLPLAPFALAGVLALLIALGTVSFQSIKAARTNPVQSLRHE